MYISKLEPNSKSYLLEYITLHESICVEFSSNFRKNFENIFIIHTKPDKITSKNEIIGAFYLDSFLLHCIPDISKISNPELLKNFIISKTKERKLNGISGEAKSTEFLINLISSELSFPYQTNNYLLMIQNNLKNPPEELSNGDEIIRCTENNIEELHPLQKAYLKEEVIPAGKQLTDLETSFHLKKILKNQLCLAVFSDGEPVSKAYTNAIGINWVQLGGIYTTPLYRRNGYAWHLVSALCKKINNSEKKVCLYVKDINIPAIQLYKKIGFISSEKYTIAYYQ